MVGRDGFVNYPLSIPAELHWLVESYKKDMKIISFNQAIRSLLETHPAIVNIVDRVYDNGSISTGDTHGERVHLA